MFKKTSVTLIFGFAFVSSFSGCFNAEKKPETVKLQIKIDKKHSNAKLLSVSSSRSYAVPTLVTGFDCLGVNVVGPGIELSAGKNSCGKTVALDRGIYAGMVPKSGGTIEVTVPVGTSRTIQIFGVTSEDGSCVNVAEFAVNPALGETFSPPYEIGRTVADTTISGPVTINSNWDSGNPTQAFCTAIPDSQIAGVWDSSNWDESNWAD